MSLIYAYHDVKQGLDEACHGDGSWVVAKPLGITFFDKVKAAWLVLTGNAFVVPWKS